MQLKPEISKPTICPICANSSKLLFVKNSYSILECLGCHYRYANIKISENEIGLIYNDQYFSGAKDGYPNYIEEGELLVAEGKKYSALLQRYMMPGKILDVGSAAGFILKGFQDSGWMGKGIEPNRTMFEYARSQLNLDVENTTLENYSDTTQYDLISMIQVVPHFFDLHKALSVAAELTRPGGYWLIETWNRDSLIAKIFGRHWHEYNPPSVLHWFSPDGLRSLVDRFGFREVSHGKPVKRIYPLHAKPLMQQMFDESGIGRLAGTVMDLFPDRFPIPYLGDDLFWVIYQRN